MTGKQLATWRINTADASMEDVVAELGVHRSTVSRLEQAPLVPRLYHLARAAVAALWNAPLPHHPK